MAIKLLCLSDLHLGEGPSLLNSDDGLRCFAQHLDTIVAGQAVDTLVLAGDVVDQVLSSSETYEARAQAFFAATLPKLPGLRKVVYLFGNHDLALFRTLFCDGQPTSRFFVTGVGEDGHPGVGRLKSRLLGDVDLPFVVANPVYVEESERRVYVFHHGHHLREDLIDHWLVYRLLDIDLVDQKLLDTELEFGSPSPADANTLEEFENGTFPLVTTFWRNRRNLEVPTQEKLYTWFHKMSHPSDGPRRVEPGARPYDLGKMALDGFGQDLIPHRYFPALRRSKLLTFPPGKPVSLIYGDTHFVGCHRTEYDGTPLTIINTGGWISYHDDVHPATAVYRVDDDAMETETLWECGFPVQQLEGMVAKHGTVTEPNFARVPKAVFEKLLDKKRPAAP
jgi:hypothetical protein